VFACFRVSVPFRETEIYHIDYVLGLLLGKTHEEVVWLDIPVDEVVRVKKLDSLQKLVS
jgi:hypothetical protein